MMGSAMHILGRALALALPSLAAATRHHHHPPLEEQEPPSWLTTLARVVLLLALAALGVATLLGCTDGSG